MKSIFAIILAISTLPVFTFGKNLHQQESLHLLENKGQITDQEGNKRGDIQFTMTSQGMNAYIGNGQIHYQFYSAEDPGTASVDGNISKPSTNIYRLDVKLIGANKNASLIKQEKLNYHQNYLSPNGDISLINAYDRVVYTDIYPNIDWVIFLENGKLEYEFVIKEGGKVSNIKLEYGGSTQLKINNDGSLTAFTPLGSITESAPISFEHSGKTVATNFEINDNVVSFNTDPYSGRLTIDPVLEWSTYYGGNMSNEYSYSIGVDNDGFVYLGGTTSSVSSINVIATTGAHQTVYGGGAFDAFIAKFDSTGVRQWATYWGGDYHENQCFLTTDNFGNIFVLTSSQSAGMATPGSHKEVEGGGDAIVAKFNSNGVRIWSTYYGGDNIDAGLAIVCDDSANIYIAGQTSSENGISTSGVFQEILTPNFNGSGDAFIAKLDSNGVRKWGTYYGGEDAEIAYALTLDTSNNVYVAGYTSSTTNISTPGSHQENYNASSDLFLAKLNNQGQRIWATYYGGEAWDKYAHLQCDDNNNIYLSGPTSSQTNIASVGSWQPVYGGGAFDHFLAKFNSDGIRQWSTYYGGSDDDSPNFIWGNGALDCDKYGNCIIGGLTHSTNAIASPGAYQLISGGAGDAFVAAFNSAGDRLWGTYYGGSNMDACMAIKMINGGSLYFAGTTASLSNISTPGSHQPLYGGSFADAFLARFNACEQMQITISQNGSTLGLPYNFLTYQWYYNGTIIQGADDSLYDYTQNGDYYAVLTDSSGCIHFSDTVTITSVSLGSLRLADAQIVVYPNPTNGILNISGNIPGADKANIAIIDKLGRIVLYSECYVKNGELTQQVDISQFPAGAYFLRLKVRDTSYMTPLLKLE